jgi:hypothetical protein
VTLVNWEKFDVPGLRGISKTAPYFHNNSAATLEEMVDHYIELFERVEALFVPGNVVPPIATTDGVHFDRKPTLEERETATTRLPSGDAAGGSESTPSAPFRISNACSFCKRHSPSPVPRAESER